MQGIAQGIQQRTADAMTYVKDMIMPSGDQNTNGDASNDPEVHVRLLLH